MKCHWLLGLLALSLAGASASAQPSPPTPVNTPTPQTTAEVAVIKTSAGEMTLEFWSDVAPNTVENFKKLARQGFYDGTAFHRIIKGFMIQGGDPKTKDATKESEWGTGDPGYKIKAEFNDRKHVRGVISMARAAHPDSAGCQFFICLDPAPSLDRQYTAFGKIIKGEDVLLKLGDTPVGPSRGERSKPLQRVALESITIVPASSTK
ncbi:MAG: peptidylprolyl isomerase [Verrucomicrobiales bacterium]|nr:peptidylprolyl isomerase [Verrucomicrobiales bacterium]